MISTHILNTALGKPAQDVSVKLFSGQGELLAEAITNQDGRIADFDLKNVQVGTYSLEFSIEPYFSKMEIDTFFPKAVIYFSITNTEQHYHIPLLISPFAYSTYRGS